MFYSTEGWLWLTIPLCASQYSNRGFLESSPHTHRKWYMLEVTDMLIMWLDHCTLCRMWKHLTVPHEDMQSLCANLGAGKECLWIPPWSKQLYFPEPWPLFHDEAEIPFSYNSMNWLEANKPSALCHYFIQLGAMEGDFHLQVSKASSVWDNQHLRLLLGGS